MTKLYDPRDAILIGVLFCRYSWELIHGQNKPMNIIDIIGNAPIFAGEVMKVSVKDLPASIFFDEKYMGRAGASFSTDNKETTFPNLPERFLLETAIGFIKNSPSPDLNMQIQLTKLSDLLERDLILGA